MSKTATTSLKSALALALLYGIGLASPGLVRALEYESSAEAQSAADAAQTQMDDSQSCVRDVFKQNDDNNREGSKLVSEAQKLYAEKDQAMKELASGMFCSKCWRTASEIEREEHTSFAQHLQNVSGQAVPAPASKIQEKAAEYDQKIKDVQDQITDHRKTYQNLVQQWNGCWARYAQAAARLPAALNAVKALKAKEAQQKAQQSPNAQKPPAPIAVPPMPPIAGLTPGQEDALARSLVPQEGGKPYFYLDSKGYVTTGVGHLVSKDMGDDGLAVAKALFPSADPASVEAEWNRLKTERDRIAALPDDELHHPGEPFRDFAAGHYAPLTTDRLTDTQVGTIFAQDISHNLGLVQATFPDFDRYPAPAQQALLDLQYNTGSLVTSGKWTDLKTALSQTPINWDTVAQDSSRQGVQPQRNQDIADLFRQAGAAQSVPATGVFPNPQPGPRPSYGPANAPSTGPAFPTPRPNTPPTPPPGQAAAPPSLDSNFERSLEDLRVLQKISEKRAAAAQRAAQDGSGTGEHFLP